MRVAAWTGLRGCIDDDRAVDAVHPAPREYRDPVAEIGTLQRGVAGADEPQVSVQRASGGRRFSGKDRVEAILRPKRVERARRDDQLLNRCRRDRAPRGIVIDEEPSPAEDGEAPLVRSGERRREGIVQRRPQREPLPIRPRRRKDRAGDALGQSRRSRGDAAARPPAMAVVPQPYRQSNDRDEPEKGENPAFTNARALRSSPVAYAGLHVTHRGPRAAL